MLRRSASLRSTCGQCWFLFIRMCNWCLSIIVRALNSLCNSFDAVSRRTLAKQRDCLIRPAVETPWTSRRLSASRPLSLECGNIGAISLICVLHFLCRCCRVLREQRGPLPGHQSLSHCPRAPFTGGAGRGAPATCGPHRCVCCPIPHRLSLREDRLFAFASLECCHYAEASGDDLGAQVCCMIGREWV